MNFRAADTPSYWLLDSVTGWRSAAQDGIVEWGSEGDLRLQSLPGAAQLYFNGSPGKFRCPVTARLDACGVLFVLDASQNRLWRMRADTGEARRIRQIGGRGHDARRFESPRGFAVLPSDGLAICDTANHRVQIFSAAPYALIQLWGKDGNQPGNGPLEFHYPWAAAYGADGWLYIVDRGNKRIQRVRSDGSAWSEFGAGALTSPTELAISPNGQLAVVDMTQQGAKLLLFSPGDWSVRALSNVEDPRSVVFDSAGNLYAGTAKGLVFKWTPDGHLVGAGVSGLEAAIVGLTSLDDKTLLAIMDEQDVIPMQRLWTIPIDGAFVSQGTFSSQAIDSRIENCAWHRIQVEGQVPTGASLLIETITSADPGDDSDFTTAFPNAETAMLATFNNPDGLVQNGQGRYLRFRITMHSNGAASPEIRALKIFFPRQSYLQYLPANFQEDDQSRFFLERFLSIFQTSFDAFDRRIDNLWRLLDPLSVPESMYNWLAAWMALPIDPDWPIAKKRQMLKSAAAQNLVRGSVAGLQQAIQDYANVPGNVLEHYRLRRWPMILSAAAQQAAAGFMTQYDARLCAATPLWGRAFAARLQVGKHSEIGSFKLTGANSPVMDAFTWGASQFTVFFPADPYDPEAAAKKVRQVVEREKPAHTQAFYAPVYARMRVGVQSSLGVDTYVSRLTYTVLNKVGTLGYDSILSASPARKSLAALGASAQPLAGLNTRLL